MFGQVKKPFPCDTVLRITLAIILDPEKLCVGHIRLFPLIVSEAAGAAVALSLSLRRVVLAYIWDAF